MFMLFVAGLRSARLLYAKKYKILYIWICINSDHIKIFPVQAHPEPMEFSKVRPSPAHGPAQPVMNTVLKELKTLWCF